MHIVKCDYMKRKGISPLIASVLLIAFTLAIAGIMATWATSYVRGQTSQISSQTECIGALDAEVKSFDSGTGSIGLIVRNLKATINLSDIKIGIEYSSAPFGRTYNVKDLGGTDPLEPLGVTGVSIATGDTRCPDKITIVSVTCDKYSQEKRKSAREIPC